MSQLSERRVLQMQVEMRNMIAQLQQYKSELSPISDQEYQFACGELDTAIDALEMTITHLE